MPIPTIGRIILHVGNDGTIRPAIITHVWSETMINCFVFPRDNGDFSSAGPCETSVHHAPVEEKKPASWHWMEYQLQTAGQRYPDLKPDVPHV